MVRNKKTYTPLQEEHTMMETHHNSIQMNIISDRDIITLVNNGNIELFDVLINRYKNRLMNYTFHVLHNYTISQGIVKEAFIRILNKQRKINNRDNICIQIFSIANKLMNDSHVARKKQRRLVTEYNRNNAHIERVVIDGYFADTPIQRALDFLDFQSREALILRDIEGMSYSDISAITRETVSKVKHRVNEARMQLTNIL